MTEVDQLIEQTTAYYPDADVELIRRAFERCKAAHDGQVREDGKTPYYYHPLAVAGILTFLKLDVTAIVAGLLHDTLEDTSVTEAELRREFGDDVVRLVEAVTKIGQIPFKSRAEKQAENFRKMLLSMADDIRVVFIKLADRLHNMKTLEHLPPNRQKHIAQETLDIYAPLANRLGISWMKQELEDLCFQYLKPDIYAMLKVRVAKRDEERHEFLQAVIETVKERLRAEGLPGEVQGRPKHLYSIYQKMQRQSITFDEVYDLTAIRIITDTKMNCYAALGLIHALWPPVPGRFKDYIATPRSNLYQSLHTTVVGPEGEYIEFQIRTEEMHRINEYGVAAHWRYKEPGKVIGRHERVFNWLRQFVEWQRDLTDNRQFMESVKLDLFHDVVFVFTPKGEVKEMPVGSTPIDFAYAIHTEIGEHCVGAKVNGKLVPLRQRLSSGDMVEILTSPSQTPHKSWLKFVRTSRARAKIKHWFKVEEHKRSLELGSRLLEREFRRQHLPISQTMKSDRLAEVSREMGFDSIDDMLRMIGVGRLATAQVVMRLQPQTQREQAKPDFQVDSSQLVRPTGKKPEEKSVRVRGGKDVLMQLSKCCHPLPGDPIMGYITRGRGLTIHAIGCPNLRALEWDRNRLVDVEWDPNIEGTHSVKLAVITLDRTGVLADISSAISNARANIARAEISTREDRKAVLDFVVEVRDLEHVERLLNAIQQVDGVITAKRVKGW
ncbi:MAG: bifunctional (p)ppGpp synthetase/guanosine-3',5'-bis(diphosphate) 3'-pyrophosphohydrolase [Nitrospirae bacterium]|nr:MAG: bifunctional (p)ppGpp synthetase/guanosine-3',5'-bis(diphosphate) 3'-pyrophosphohydrolase [Nitrospirota bacterium]